MKKFVLALKGLGLLGLFVLVAIPMMIAEAMDDPNRYEK